MPVPVVIEMMKLTALNVLLGQNSRGVVETFSDRVVIDCPSDASLMMEGASLVIRQSAGFPRQPSRQVRRRVTLQLPVCLQEVEATDGEVRVDVGSVRSDQLHLLAAGEATIKLVSARPANLERVIASAEQQGAITSDEHVVIRRRCMMYESERGSIQLHVSAMASMGKWKEGETSWTSDAQSETGCSSGIAHELQSPPHEEEPAEEVV